MLTPAATRSEHEGVVGDEVVHQRGAGLHGDEPLPVGEAVFVLPLATLGMEDLVLRAGAFPEGFLKDERGVGDGARGFLESMVGRVRKGRLL